MQNKKLFSQYKLGSFTLSNRVVMAPMTRSRAPGNQPNEMMARYYGQRASAGLIITEGVSPSPHGLGYARIPGCFSPEHAKGWRMTADAVHSQGGHLFMQLMHTGRASHPANMQPGTQVLAPSPIALKGQIWTDTAQMQNYPAPKEMTIEQIRSTIKEYADAAALAISAGFDGVELHAANGYLMDQFLNPASNQRNDEYGGSSEKRHRFTIEVATAVIAKVGAERVGIRVSPYGVFNDMIPYEGLEESYASLAKKLNKLGLCYMHIVDHSSMGAPEVKASVKSLIRSEFKNTLILSGGYDAVRSEADLVEKRADLIAFGRPFISNPDLVEKLNTGMALRPADPSLFYTPGEKGYTDYPAGA